MASSDSAANPDPTGASPGAGLSVILVTGVAGSGKTTVGMLLAAQLGWRFRDGDEFHSFENIAKMSSGVALNDRDRGPWLAAIRDYIDACLADGTRTVIACSALRAKYRETLVADPVRVRIVHLDGDFELIRERLARRQGHFMRPEMLQSQFAALEAPADALTIDVAQTPEAIVAQVRNVLQV